MKALTCVIGVTCFAVIAGTGFWVMSHVDRFLEENEKQKKRERNH